MRQADFLNDRPHRLKLAYGGPYAGGHTRMNAINVILFWQTDAQAFDVLADGGGEIGNLYIQGGGVEGIVTAKMVQHQRCIFHGLRDRTDLVKRRSEGD